MRFDPDKTYNFGETLGPAMEIRSADEADAYFKELVDYAIEAQKRSGEVLSREQAEERCRGNLGYYAGYYSSEVRARVEKLFRCAHPILGSIEGDGEPTATEALAAGEALAERAEGNKASGASE